MIRTTLALLIALAAVFFAVRSLLTGVALAGWSEEDGLAFEKEREPLSFWGLVGLQILIAAVAFYTALA